MNILKRKALLAIVVVCIFSLQMLHGQNWNMSEVLDSMGELPANLGVLPAVTIPVDNPQTKRKAKLGQELFFEKDLSGDRSISCATCHNPKKGFSDSRPRAIGFDGKELPRHSPTVLNAAYYSSQFWDGRASSLEDQARGPITAAGEMNLPDETELTRRLEANAHYQREFRAVFGEKPNLKNVAKAIASYERTLITRNSRFDQYVLGNKHALTPTEKNGLVLFIGKAGCSQCHSGPNFSDNKFYNLGVDEARDSGRFAITNEPGDLGSFKTPGLRNIASRSPYMHDGSLTTLEQVIEYYDRGGDDAKNKSKLLHRLQLAQQEKRDLQAFLLSLTGEVSASANIR